MDTQIWASSGKQQTGQQKCALNSWQDSQLSLTVTDPGYLQLHFHTAPPDSQGVYMLGSKWVTTSEVSTPGISVFIRQKILTLLKLQDVSKNKSIQLKDHSSFPYLQCLKRRKCKHFSLFLGQNCNKSTLFHGYSTVGSQATCSLWVTSIRPTIEIPPTKNK